MTEDTNKRITRLKRLLAQMVQITEHMTEVWKTNVGSIPEEVKNKIEEARRAAR